MEQENNAGEDYQHCISIGDNTWCVSTVSVSVNSCGWFKQYQHDEWSRVMNPVLLYSRPVTFNPFADVAGYIWH